MDSNLPPTTRQKLASFLLFTLSTGFQSDGLALLFDVLDILYGREATHYVQEHVTCHRGRCAVRGWPHFHHLRQLIGDI